MKSDLYEKLKIALLSVIPPGRIRFQEPMTLHTTFQIGGPADFLVFPNSIHEVAAALDLARQHGIAVTVLGNGSNVLVLDHGIRGMVIKFGNEMGYIRHNGNGTKVIAGAGALLSDVSSYAAQHHLSGLEFAIGIPGSIGGAVFMNAGAYEGEISQVVDAVTGVCPDGSIKRFTYAEIDFGYRHSIFQDNDCTICEVELALCDGIHQDIHCKMGEYTAKRQTKQPIEMPSAGSTFKRPPGYFAGTLIEQAGLKGLQIGGAQVSLKHAGFVVNAGGATAQDVLALIKEIQHRVNDQFGVLLQPEVRIIGEA
ncbi:UDP-N-acetylmuramate dehydrogenase [Lucifera butyrica]|uniref:UDP-N-acetylmuramate dehydrogenase n=1 Tax=Lucifera butyrica TaxID=1351585 RepID=UPI001FB361AF|nr:UDP-N-acetylmuramate dehydrogenase [Lucifera butyrica]